MFTFGGRKVSLTVSLMDSSDAILVARAVGGDQSAYEVLVRRHFAAAYSVALALTGVPQDAEDVCQDALVQGYQRLGECRSPDRFRAWLIQIVRNRAHNYRRYQFLRRTSALDEVREPESEDSPSRDVELADLRARLLHALRNISRIQREVVVLHDLEGFSHGDVAEALGISEMMSRQHLSAARKKLRAMLSDVATDSDGGKR
jgi:RNA polymerase sigma-70 factor (ECF subfamily)